MASLPVNPSDARVLLPRSLVRRGFGKPLATQVPSHSAVDMISRAVNTTPSTSSEDLDRYPPNTPDQPARGQPMLARSHAEGGLLRQGVLHLKIRKSAKSAKVAKTIDIKTGAPPIAASAKTIPPSKAA